MKKYLKLLEKKAGRPLVDNEEIVKYLKLNYKDMDKEDIESDFESCLEYENDFTDSEGPLEHNIETLACIWCGLISIPFDMSFCASSQFYLLKVDMLSKTLPVYLLNEDLDSEMRLTPLLAPSLKDVIEINKLFYRLDDEYSRYELNRKDAAVLKTLDVFEKKFPYVYNFFLDNYNNKFADLVLTKSKDPQFVFHELFQMALYYSANYFGVKRPTKPISVQALEAERKIDTTNIPLVFLKILSLKSNGIKSGFYDELRVVIENSGIQLYKDWLKKL